MGSIDSSTETLRVSVAIEFLTASVEVVLWSKCWRVSGKTVDLLARDLCLPLCLPEPYSEPKSEPSLLTLSNSVLISTHLYIIVSESWIASSSDVKLSDQLLKTTTFSYNQISANVLVFFNGEM